MVEKVVKWQANDGTLHDSEGAAKDHEKFAAHLAIATEAIGSWDQARIYAKIIWCNGFKIVRRRN